MCKAIIFTSGIAAGRSVSCPCLVSQGLSEVGTMLQSGVHVQTISLAAGFNHSAKLHAQPSHWLTFSVSHTVLPQEVTSTRPLVVPRRVRPKQQYSVEGIPSWLLGAPAYKCNLPNCSEASGCVLPTAKSDKTSEHDMESFLVIRGLCWHHEAIKSPAVQNRPLSVVHRWICILLIIGDGFWGLGICIF
jgi:hypothetical protein